MSNQMYDIVLKMTTLFDLIAVIERPRCIGMVKTHDGLSSFTIAAVIQTPELQITKEMSDQMHHGGLWMTVW